MSTPLVWTEERCACVEWRTNNPIFRPGVYEDGLRSPTFKLQEDEYYFCLYYRGDCKGTDYRLYIHRGEMRSPIFDTIVYLVNGAEAVFVPSTLAPTDIFVPIWACSVSKILKKIPDFENQRTICFRVIFGSVSPTKKTESTAVQTPLYFDNFPCLESLSQDFSQLLEDHHRTPSDVSLKCGHHTIQSHRTVLSSRSEVFAAMLHSDMVEKRTGVVELQDMDVAIFQEFVQYLYSGKTSELDMSKAKKLYEAGDKYAVSGLVRRCVRFFADNLSSENACDILALADTHSDQELKERVTTYILGNKVCCEDEVWLPFSSSHPTLAVEVLNRFIKLQKL